LLLKTTAFGLDSLLPKQKAPFGYQKHSILSFIKITVSNFYYFIKKSLCFTTYLYFI